MYIGCICKYNAQMQETVMPAGDKPWPWSLHASERERKHPDEIPHGKSMNIIVIHVSHRLDELCLMIK